jgi:hypothetical protein
MQRFTLLFILIHMKRFWQCDEFRFDIHAIICGVLSDQYSQNEIRPTTFSVDVGITIYRNLSNCSRKETSWRKEMYESSPYFYLLQKNQTTHLQIFVSVFCKYTREVLQSYIARLGICSSGISFVPYILQTANVCQRWERERSCRTSQNLRLDGSCIHYNIIWPGNPITFRERTPNDLPRCI